MANLMSRKINWWWLSLLAVPFLFSFRRRGWGAIVEPQKIRNDAAGDGSFKVSRDNGAREHNGIDLLVNSGQLVHSPIPGTVSRYSFPYPEDTRWGGILIQGTGEYIDYQVKIFYITPRVNPGQVLDRGQIIGKAQSIHLRYNSSSMQDHVHVEIRKNGTLIDPASVLSVMT
jgi:murein DD-endopeptidase MepM/ murein hydrolase activator NlpD